MPNTPRPTHHASTTTIEPQRIDAPLTASAIFLVATITPTRTALRTVRTVLSSLSSLAKNASSRDPAAAFTCTAGIGSAPGPPSRPRSRSPIIGRRKSDNFELADAAAGRQQSHESLATIGDGDGGEILRDNMPFGSPGAGEFGTYFVGYAGRLWVVERMLQRMFVGEPPGLHDRLLDFLEAGYGDGVFCAVL